MGEQRQIRTRFWNRMPTKRCSANGLREEFIVVDDDEVIILDFPESSSTKDKAAAGTSRTGNNKSVLQRVISIDDDDDDDDDDGETENVHKAGCSSSSGNPLADNLQPCAEVDNDECQFIQEKCATFRLSKCNQTFSTTTATPGFQFGLDSETESDDLSESECSDCEIFEPSDKEVREQWEKANLSKMKKAGKAGLREEAGPSNLHSETNFIPGFGSRTEQHNQPFFFFAPRNPVGGRRKTSSTFFGTDGNIPDMGFSGSEMEKDNRYKTHEKVFPGPSPVSPETEHERFDTPPTRFTSSKESIHQTSFEKGEEQPDIVHVQCETSKLPEGNLKQKAAYQSNNTQEVEEEEDVSKFSLPQTSPVLETQRNGARCEHDISSLNESREPIIDPVPSTSGQVQGINGTAPTIDVMLNRETLKETDEYKKAQEEEWESRQRQLQIQAEEAQKQRKKRKLENSRVTRQLEVERRQKERVEEVRETQKKDEESMNMKEKVRAEITKSLKQLELTSFNMASLLRGLGIHVGGGIYPLQQEVHAAYKRAVLKFHPDRASGGDIKQQVEAEEKFKLIARMKDKFSSTSFR